MSLFFIRKWLDNTPLYSPSRWCCVLFCFQFLCVGNRWLRNEHPSSKIIFIKGLLIYIPPIPLESYNVFLLFILILWQAPKLVALKVTNKTSSWSDTEEMKFCVSSWIYKTGFTTPTAKFFFLLFFHSSLSEKEIIKNFTIGHLMNINFSNTQEQWSGVRVRR